MSAILKTTGLTKTFGAVTAANDLDVSIEAGSVVGLIGGNGAGKTTFINMVTGYLKPTSGTIHFDGRDITGQPPRHITRLGLCRSFQIPQLFDSLTVREPAGRARHRRRWRRKAFVGGALGQPAARGGRRGDAASASGSARTATSWPARCRRACASCSTSPWRWW